ncbi:MAG: hypothetical protein HYZ34_09820 [Ignavibacteriae bacterium]|nr:hypothetical protein [Ignavibacteriota bacterium]
MPHLDNLIRERAYTVLAILSELFEDKLLTSPLENFEIQEIFVSRELALTLQLIDGSIVECYEKYKLSEYQLDIKYYYAYKDSSGNTLVSFDNTPHHSDMPTFPHHKHHYPKNRYKPLSFSGNIYHAMAEILWIVENRNN